MGTPHWSSRRPVKLLAVYRPDVTDGRGPSRRAERSSRKGGHMATKPLPAGGEVPAPAAAGLLTAYTCIGCGLRSASWGAFRAHRAVCSGRQYLRAPRPGASVAPAAPVATGRPAG